MWCQYTYLSHDVNRVLIIHVYHWQSPDDLKSMAVEAILLLQGKINDEDDDTVGCRLLVLSKVIGCIIGKGGSTINEIRKRTNADVRISKGAKPNCADSNDELVEVWFVNFAQFLVFPFSICKYFFWVDLVP